MARDRSLPRLPQIPTAQPGSPCRTHGCSACCHDTQMLLTEADVVRLAVARPDVDFAQRTEDDFLQLRTRDGPAAKGGTGRPCVFLAPDGQCTVHDLRPEGCRLYPAFYDEAAGRAILDRAHCPHTDGFLLPAATQDAVRRLVQRLVDEAEARSKR